jgi:hypothetical protein
MKSSNKEPDLWQIKCFRNSGSPNAYEDGFWEKNNLKRKTEPGIEMMEEENVM